jgi:hypothetical protein
MASKAPMPLKGLIVPFLLAGFLVAGYWFYWSRAAVAIETHVRAALPSNAVSTVKVTGFPYRLTLEVVDVRLVSQRGNGFQASSIVATATPFNPLLWVLEGADDPRFISSDGVTHPLKATALKASLRLNKKGLERFSLAFDTLETQGEGSWRLGRGLVHLMTGFKDETTLAFVGEVDGIQLPKALDGPGAILGQTVNRVRIAGPIDQGQTLIQSQKRWQAVGGKLNVMAGELLWGPVSLTNATGTLSLSPDLQWQGTLNGQGALKPEGVAVAGLSAPIGLELRDGRLSVAGLPGFDVSDAFR